MDESECERLGLRVVEPTLSQAREAISLTGKLSLQDSLCLMVCRDHAWTCVTNDKALRRSCAEFEITTLWGLEVMLQLAKAGHLPVKDAEAIAEQIHRSNPFFLSPKVIDAFKARLKEQGE